MERNQLPEKSQESRKKAASWCLNVLNPFRFNAHKRVPPRSASGQLPPQMAMTARCDQPRQNQVQRLDCAFSLPSPQHLQNFSEPLRPCSRPLDQCWQVSISHRFTNNWLESREVTILVVTILVVTKSKQSNPGFHPSVLIRTHRLVLKGWLLLHLIRHIYWQLLWDL